MNAVHFALLAAFSYGTADFLASYFARQASAVGIAMVSLFAGGVSLLAAAVVVPGSWHVGDIPWILSAAACNAVGTAALFRGLAVGAVSLVAPLSGVVVSVIACLWDLGTGGTVGGATAAGLGLGALAIPLMAGAPVRGVASRPDAAGLGLLAGVGFGGSWVSISNFDESSGLLPIGVELILSAIVLCGLRLRPAGPTRLAPRFMAAASGIGVLGAVATACFVASTRHGEVASAAVIAALYPGVAVLWARYWYGEVLGRRRWGLALAVAAVCLMA